MKSDWAKPASAHNTTGRTTIRSFLIQKMMCEETNNEEFRKRKMVLRNLCSAFPSYGHHAHSIPQT
jgi:hypothetical protein